MKALDEGLVLFLDPKFFLLHRKFQHAMRMAQTAMDMEERLNWSNRAFQVVEAINPGPLSRDEARAMGTLHAIRGQAHLELRARDYASFSRLAVSDLEAATTYLTTEDGTYWSQAMNLLSRAYFENVDGNPADNIENAIKTAEAALSAIDPLRDRGVWIEMVHNLAGYHESRIYGVPRENKQKALSIMRRLHAVVSVQFDALEWAMVTASLGLAYHKYGGNNGDDTETAIRLIESALPTLRDKASLENWVGSNDESIALLLNANKGRLNSQ